MPAGGWEVSPKTGKGATRACVHTVLTWNLTSFDAIPKEPLTERAHTPGTRHDRLLSSSRQPCKGAGINRHATARATEAEEPRDLGSTVSFNQQPVSS